MNKRAYTYKGYLIRKIGKALYRAIGGSYSTIADAKIAINKHIADEMTRDNARLLGIN